MSTYIYNFDLATTLSMPFYTGYEMNESFNDFPNKYIDKLRYMLYLLEYLFDTFFAYQIQLFNKLEAISGDTSNEMNVLCAIPFLMNAFFWLLIWFFLAHKDMVQ